MESFKKIYQQIFSIKNRFGNKIVTFLGLKFKIIKKKNRVITQEAIKTQDNYDFKRIETTKSLIVFFIPPENETGGGIMSIFSLCQASRDICQNAEVLISTYPGNITYAKNDFFNNTENIYRWDLITNKASNVENMILHIPECYANHFYSELGKKDIAFLKKIKNLHINIMNQNIQYMAEPDELNALYKLTNNITQTIAHNRYATQEVCNKWQIPTHLFSVNIDISKYKAYPFDEKEKIILLSPDENKDKEQIISKLRLELPDFQLITIQNMTFDEYMDAIAKAYFTVTFGEGIDGYFLQPTYVDSVGLAVYNDEFFPDESWQELDCVFKSYEDMEEKIVDTINQLYKSKDDYTKMYKAVVEKTNKIYTNKGFDNNLIEFYEGKYHYLPL